MTEENIIDDKVSTYLQRAYDIWFGLEIFEPPLKSISDGDLVSNKERAILEIAKMIQKEENE